MGEVARRRCLRQVFRLVMLVHTLLLLKRPPGPHSHSWMCASPEKLCLTHSVASMAGAPCPLPQFPSLSLSHAEDDRQGMRDALALEGSSH